MQRTFKRGCRPPGARDARNLHYFASSSTVAKQCFAAKGGNCDHSHDKDHRRRVKPCTQIQTQKNKYLNDMAGACVDLQVSSREGPLKQGMKIPDHHKREPIFFMPAIAWWRMNSSLGPTATPPAACAAAFPPLSGTTR
mmetsp:Transcript_19647/g.52396  ORF Transcript_19647/g.52396 Transcript_19647/m.52396 type:complete len:139 (-) Transcript_19647:936-1352(-)